MKKGKTINRFLAMLLAVSITLGLMLSIMPVAAAAEDGGQGSMEADKENVLKRLDFPLNKPSDAELNDTSNPYGPGTAALQTYDELFISYTSIGEDKSYLAAFDSDYNGKTGAATGYALQMERFQIAPTIAIQHTEEMTYSMVYGGDFDGDGRANEVAQLYMYGNMYQGNYMLRILNGDTSVTASAIELVAPTVVGSYDFGSDKANRVDPWEITSYLAGTVGDFDGDGIDEIAVYNLKGDGGKGCISVYKVNGLAGGSGTFKNVQNISLPDGARNNLNAGTSKNKFLALSLAAGSLNQKTDEIDDLVVMISYHKNSFGTSDKDALNAGSQMVIYHGGQKTGGPLQQVSHIKGTDNKGIYFDNSGETLILRYASASIGDINGDGFNEIVVGGLCSFSGAGHWNLHKYEGDGKQAYSIITYFNADGTHPQGSSGGIYNKGFSKMRPMDGMMHIYDSDLCNAPVALTTFKADGDGAQESVFMSGKVFKYDSSSGDFKQDDEANAVISVADTYYSGMSNRWYSQAVAGNFNSNIQGVESVMYVHGSKVSGQETYYFNVGTVTRQPRDNTYGNYAVSVPGLGAWTATWNPHIYKEKRGNMSVAAVDIDNDSLLVRFVEKSYYFSNPNIIAVMQAAPHFSELEVLENGYTTKGSTVYEKSVGESTTHDEAVTVSAGVVVGMEQEFSFFGLAKVGFDYERSIVGSVGYAYESSTEITYSTAFESESDTDRVALVMTPYTKYEYDMFIPTYSIITEEEYNSNKAQIEALEIELAKYTSDAKEYDEIALQILNLKEACRIADKAVKDGYKLGQTVEGAWSRFSLSLPREVCTALITVDQYDSIASQYSDMSTIRGNILPANYEAGNPGSYRSSIPNSLENDEDAEVSEGKAVGGDGQGWLKISNSGGNSTATIAKMASKSHGITWGLEISDTLIAKVGGGKAGITTSLAYEGGFSWTETTGNSITASVANAPNKSDAAGYSFYWKFFGYIAKLDGKECQVIEYLVKNVEAPPALPAILRLSLQQ